MLEIENECEQCEEKESCFFLYMEEKERLLGELADMCVKITPLSADILFGYNSEWKSYYYKNLYTIFPELEKKGGFQDVIIF